MAKANRTLQRMQPSTAMATSSGIGCMLVLTLWGFGGRYGVGMLVPFAVLFGVASGGFTSMWSQSAVQIVGHDKEQQILLVSGERSCELECMNASAHHLITAGVSFLSRQRSWSCYRSHYRRCPLSRIADGSSPMGFGGFPRLGVPRSREYGLQCSRRNPFRIF